MSHPPIDRRAFLAASAAVLPGLGAAAASQDKPQPSALAGRRRPDPAGRGGPVAISSGNGLPAVTRAMELMRQGADPVEAIVEGVGIVEADENDMSVGKGGLPNERGVVQLDSSVMHGPTHKAGAVAALENIVHPARVALDVLRKTDHVLIVGAGALEFARSMGHPEENLLTERARRVWLHWKRNLNSRDDWLDDDQQLPVTLLEEDKQAIAEVMTTWGTIHCSALDAHGNLAGCTTTSGLSFKIPGRVGDSPIVGAGMFTDNEVGSAGATGRGEAVIQSCGSFQIVRHMAEGLEPEAACLKALQWIADHTKRTDLLNDRGEPNFQVTYYALRKDGAYGSASMRPGATFTVHDPRNPAPRKLECRSLFT